MGGRAFLRVSDPPIPKYQICFTTYTKPPADRLSLRMNPLPPGIAEVLSAMVAHQILWWALSLEVRVQAWEGKTSKRSLADTP